MRHPSAWPTPRALGPLDCVRPKHCPLCVMLHKELVLASTELDEKGSMRKGRAFLQDEALQIKLLKDVQSIFGCDFNKLLGVLDLPRCLRGHL